MDPSRHASFAWPRHWAGAASLAIACLGLPVLRAETPLQSRVGSLRQSQARRPLASSFGHIEGRQLQGGTSLYRSFDLHIVYKVKSSAPFSSVFDDRALREISRLERHLRSMPAWRAVCDRSTSETIRLCRLGLSAANYFFASREAPDLSTAPSKLTFDGGSSIPLPRELALGLIERHGLEGLLLPTNKTAVHLGRVRMLRSSFRFRFICCTTLDPKSYREPVMAQLREDWTQFFVDNLSPAFDDVFAKSSIFEVQQLVSGVPGHGADSCTFADPFLPDSQVFDVFFQNPPISEPVCSEQGFHHVAAAASCPVVWCEAKQRPAAVQNGTDCSCFRHQRPACGDEPMANVTLRLVAPQHFSLRQLSGRAGDVVGAESEPLGLDSANATWSAGRLPMPAVLHEGVDLVAGLLTQASGLLRRRSANASCGWTDVCFCGAGACQLDRDASWNVTRPLHLDQVNYSESAASLAQREQVYVVWGLDESRMVVDPSLGQGASSWQLPHFVDSFLPQLPQTQRDIYSFCRNLPQDLNVHSKSCWIEDFRDWLKSHDGRYPVPMVDFHDTALNFSHVGVTGATRSRDFLWMTNGTVRAFFASFVVDVSSCMTANGAAAYKKKWDSYVKSWNHVAHRSAQGAWHTSRLWQQIQYQEAPPSDQRVSGGTLAGATPGWAALAVAVAGLLGAGRPLSLR